MWEIRTRWTTHRSSRVRELVGPLTDDEAALVRTLTPADLHARRPVEHLFDLVDLLRTMRGDEAMADYVYAIAPDGTAPSSRCCSGRVTTAFAKLELEQLRPGPGARRAGRTSPALGPSPQSADRSGG